MFQIPELWEINFWYLESTQSMLFYCSSWIEWDITTSVILLLTIFPNGLCFWGLFSSCSVLAWVFSRPACKTVSLGNVLNGLLSWVHSFLLCALTWLKLRFCFRVFIMLERPHLSTLDVLSVGLFNFFLIIFF